MQAGCLSCLFLSGIGELGQRGKNTIFEPINWHCHYLQSNVEGEVDCGTSNQVRDQLPKGNDFWRLPAASGRQEDVLLKSEDVVFEG